MTAVDLRGRVAIVTGGGRGLGRSYSQALATAGARVLVNDTGCDATGGGASSEVAEEAAESIRATGGEAEADAHDVTVDAKEIVTHAQKRWGRVDAVVNNAGISTFGDLDEMAASEWDQVFDVHLRGTVALVRLAWPLFRSQRYGRVVNTSSSTVFGLSHNSHYIAAKAALIGLTRALAADGGDLGIVVNALMPSAYSRLAFDLDDAYQHYLAQNFPPERVAPMVVALCSEEVPCSGEVFIAGGGRFGRMVLGATRGWVDRSAQAGDVLDHLEQIMELEHVYFPTDLATETQAHAEILDIELQGRLP